MAELATVRISALKAGSDFNKPVILLMSASSLASADSNFTVIGRNTGSLHNRSGGRSAGFEPLDSPLVFVTSIQLIYRPNPGRALAFKKKRDRRESLCYPSPRMSTRRSA